MVFLAPKLYSVSPISPRYTKSKILLLIVKIVLHSVNEGDSTKPEDSSEKKPEPTTNADDASEEKSKEEAPSDEEHTEL